MPITGYFFFTYFHIYHFSNYKGLQGPYFPINEIPGKLDTAFSVDKKRQKKFSEMGCLWQEGNPICKCSIRQNSLFWDTLCFLFLWTFYLEYAFIPFSPSKPCLCLWKRLNIKMCQTHSRRHLDQRGQETAWGTICQMSKTQDDVSESENLVLKEISC